MGELLQNILALRDEINKLTELGNEDANMYCELAIQIADIKEDISNMGLKQKKAEEDIYDFKLKKSLLFTSPIGLAISVSYFTYCIISCWNKLTFSTSFLAIIGTPTFGGFIAYMISSFLVHSKKFNSFIFRKYPLFKTINDKLNNLNTSIRLAENNLNNLKTKHDEIITTITNNEEMLKIKKEELNKLEREYFNNIKNNPVTKGTTYNVSATYKRCTLTRGNEYR